MMFSLSKSEKIAQSFHAELCTKNLWRKAVLLVKFLGIPEQVFLEETLDNFTKIYQR